MEVEIVIASKEIIKPSSPTPDSRSKYRLSFLDQISPCTFMPLVYFYPADGRMSNQEISTRLKESLSDVLTGFYPLAGRVVDNLYVDCNDVGVEYFEAKATAKLSEFLGTDNPVDPHQIDKFLPYDLFDVKDRCMAVQASFFDCGGMALALIISHKLADATGMCMCVNSWAAIARGEAHQVRYPKFEAATIFPPRDVPNLRPIARDNEAVTKIFVFPDSKIATLRDKYYNPSSGDDHQNNPTRPPRRPSRIQALTTFLWIRFMASTNQGKTDESHHHNKIYALVQIANLRTRFDPPLYMSEDYFGNMARAAVAILSEQDQHEKEGGYRVVEKQREALSNINGEYIAKLQEGETGDKPINREQLVSFMITSLCGFPFYETDFGWGKPIWVASSRQPFANLATLLDSPFRDGIEVWLSLKKEDMAKFEADVELRQLLASSS